MRSGHRPSAQIRAGIDALVADRADAPAAAWRSRYDGFRLDTCGFWSHLPGQRIPRRYGRWPKRDDIVDYFDDYVRRQGLRLAQKVEVSRLSRIDDGWRIDTESDVLTAEAVLVATGNFHTPIVPPWPGTEDFSGALLHSAHYRNARPFIDRDVLVVGSGNSATDIALQLADAEARRVRMAVRRPPQLVPRSAAGVPVDAFSPGFSRLPAPILDNAARVMQRLWFGEVRKAGLPVPEKGIYTALLEDGQIPTLGDELARNVVHGRIEVVAAVQSFDRTCVVLADETTIEPDVVIAATGYRRGLEPLVGHLGVLDGKGRPVSNGVPSAAAGLWFAGYEEPLIGPLRSFRLQASGIARDIAGYLEAAS
ncbi:NAD(P)/FAD-dependent oxidoreductase [Mycobacterium sp. ITM-2016-00318]|uniref:flavin-containing monooxygenase n=1 Tax=Mycobacterium sp. ITM-2016-00318 TaxID=2099693 RepID=UPI001E34DC79|nr:NAD(P)/FAD-dependent oxidoreductase [Mycobacterium sp. ITM-2016-00318]WNG94413.1 NAD(P)/FAD-dependent oxidoreductase [Mycobacterium sp. ITM-2016-00318]